MAASEGSCRQPTLHVVQVRTRIFPPRKGVPRVSSLGEVDVDGSLARSDRRTPASLLVGRGQEVAEIDRFLDRSKTGLHSLLLSGQAGIGKTTLWLDAVEAAQARGYLALSCRPTEAEAAFSFVGLADLIGGVRFRDDRSSLAGGVIPITSGFRYVHEIEVLGT